MQGALPIVLMTLVPAGAAALGALLGMAWRPGAITRSSVQHFTAGVVLAAVGVELLPELSAASPLSMSIGFLLGGGAMLAIRALAGEGEEHGDGEAHTVGEVVSKGSLALLATVGVDLFIDGMLSAVTLAAAPESGFVVVAALSLEVFFLGLATVVTLGQSVATLLKSFGLFVLIPVGGLIGALAFAAAPANLQAGVLAFATAALLYLVAEELLAEAHEDAPDTPISAGAFFLGFLAVLLLKAVEG